MEKTIGNEVVKEKKPFFTRLKAPFNKKVENRERKENELAEEAANKYRSFLQLHADTTAWLGVARQTNERIRDSQQAELSSEKTRRQAEIEKFFEGGLSQVETKFIQLTKGLIPSAYKDLTIEEWKKYIRKDKDWEPYSPPGLNSRLPALLRVGKYLFDEHGVELQAPCYVPIIGSPNGNMLFLSKGPQKARALDAMQAVMFRLITSVPPSKLRFTLLDPIGLGRNVAGFMNLPEELYGFKAWTEPRQIETQLQNLSEHIETVIQKYLRNDYATMEEYNRKVGELAEPYRILVVADFPANFNESAAQRLLSIAKNGPRTGVYCLIMADLENKPSFNFPLQELIQFSNVIELINNNYIWSNSNFRNIPLKLDPAPSSALFNLALPKIAEKVEENSKVQVLFPTQKLTRNNWWRESTAEMLRVDVGKMGAKEQYLELGSGTSHSGLIVGRPGSGKSVLLHTIILSLVTKYSPDELELYLLDFKEVEFKTYANQKHPLPHARVVAIKVEREFGLSVLEGLDEELKRRMEIFRVNHCVSLKEARQKVKERLPRLLMIADEFQELFAEDDMLGRRSIQLIDRIVRQGRAFGMHILMASQTLAGSNPLPRSTVDQMAVRIALQCSNADSRLIFSDENDAARLLSRPGEAIYNSANGLVEGNSPFQAYFLDKDQREGLLLKIKEESDIITNKLQGSTPSTIIFEGDEAASLANSPRLNSELDKSSWNTYSRSLEIRIGSPVSIKDSTSFTLKRQGGQNVLVVGQPEETGLASLLAIATEITSQIDPESAQFVFLDLTNVDDPLNQHAQSLFKGLPHRQKYLDRRGLTKAIDEVFETLQQRLSQPDQPITHSIYLLIHGIQRARELRSPDGYTQTEVAEKLAAIYRDGPDSGIHTILWSDNYINLTRVMDRRYLSEFSWRLVTQVSEEDSNGLLSGPAASRLGDNRAYCYNLETNQMEKYIPFGLPSQTELENIGERLRMKADRAS